MLGYEIKATVRRLYIGGGFCMPTIYHAKDNTLKSIFGDNLLFTQFLHDLVPLDILKSVRPEDITDLSERYLPLFQESRDSDTVKRIKLPGSPPLFVIAIVEHESKVNFRTPFKMLQYICLVLNEYEKEQEKLIAIRKLRELGVAEEIIAASFPQGLAGR
jgi:hypothetical protein